MELVLDGLWVDFFAERLGHNRGILRMRKSLSTLRSSAGERFVELELNARIMISAVTDDARGSAEAVAFRQGVESRTVLDSPFALIGTATEIADARAGPNIRIRSAKTKLGDEVVNPGIGHLF